MTTTWEAVERSAKQNRCRCALEPGMNAAQLLALGGGCTMPGYCCPTLDAYRRRVGPVPLAVVPAKPEPKQVHAARYDPHASQVRIASRG